jgi:hypothetical protein
LIVFPKMWFGLVERGGSLKSHQIRFLSCRRSRR